MLHFPDPMLVGLLLNILMFPIRRQWNRTVGGSIRVEDTNIKEGLIIPATPNATCCNV